MGRKERREREQKRESHAMKHRTEQRKQRMIAVGVLAGIAAIVGYAAITFAETGGNAASGGPEGAGVLGSDHTHTAILVKLHGDRFDFSSPAYQIKSSWIHFEGSDGSTIHKHATGVTLGYLFESLAISLDENCFVFADGRQFCTNDEFTLQYFVNGEQVDDIRDYEPGESDRVLVTYGKGEQVQGELLELESQPLIR
ncbi:conserved hypothetical protein [Nitrosopumilaceae archaeon]|nr:protein-disulfide isomerase [Nitrosopumilus sp.]CAI9831321.1 conserved hypothetical protein [Nitrosopumilaceae archaeon]MDA7944302.1 protein-disulfide isomerase [Nitrosopumilus sp.]MDA7954054.1 protein-disulfide isomerase [Nitrosopumilus sp.]MDA7972982.1 protein-disulfide isomerase [Nitrosopumilus sp.]